MAGARPLYRRHPEAQAGTQGHNPGAQLPDARNFSWSCRPDGRFSSPGAGSNESKRGSNRYVRRSFHGRNGQADESVKNGPDSGSGGRMLPGRVDNGRRHSAAAQPISRRPRRDLCQHLGRGQSRIGHLLHFSQRARSRRVDGLRSGHFSAGRVSRPLRRQSNQKRSHTLERPLRSA